MQKKTFPRWLMVALALAALALLAGGVWFYRAQERALRREAEAELTAIAQLKVGQIVQWRVQQLANAAVSVESPFLSVAIAQWLAAPQAEYTEQILAHLRSLQENYHYYDVLLVDTGGQVRLSLSGYRGPLHQEATQALAAALAERQPVLSELQRGLGDVPPRIDALAPVFVDDGETSEPLGAIVFESDARQFLYPLIQSWPVPSNSAESLLVRRDGDEVLFLNDLRFQSGAAPSLRLPLSRADLPAVMAVQGQQGVVQGVDYRGVEVLSALKAVPDSPWFLVAKVDAAEALSVTRRESTLILALLLGLVFTAAVGGAAVWQNNARAHYHTLYEAEMARLEIEQRHHTTLMSVGDGVIVADANGRVELLNPVAEALTGWSRAEARGRPLAEVFRIVDEETRQPVEDPAGRVLREGDVVDLANYTLLIARDGTERPIADSSAPIRSEQGEIGGVVVVFSDQSAGREAKKALQESEDKFKYFFDASNVGKSITFPTGQVNVNKAFADLLGYDQEGLSGKTWQELTPADEIEASQRILDPLLKGERDSARFSKQYLHKNGSHVWVDVSTRIRRDAEGKPLYFVTTIVDITERMRAEARIIQLNSELEQRVEERTRELRETQEQLIRQEKLAVLGQLAGGVGHELRNPLGVMSNAVYLLKLVQPDADEQVQEYLHLLESEIRNAERIISDLLDFSRLRSVDRQPVSAKELAASTLERYPAPEGVSVTLDFPATLPALFVDLHQMEQVLGNLVVNAYQAMQQGGHLALSGSRSEDQVAIAVADTGPGISPENLDKIFQPLFTTKARGIGLGLALVETLVEGQSGTIEVESRVGEGSTFTVRLPLSVIEGTR